MFDEYDSKLNPEDRVNHITDLLNSWIERNAPKYFNRDRLESLVRKIRQQYIGNIRKCKDWNQIFIMVLLKKYKSIKNHKLKNILISF